MSSSPGSGKKRKKAKGKILGTRQESCRSPRFSKNGFKDVLQRTALGRRRNKGHPRDLETGVKKTKKKKERKSCSDR